MLGREIARPEWLLDGWERICLLWRAADERINRQMTLTEMVALVPTVPREADEWVEGSLDFGSLNVRKGRMVMLGEDWRTGVTTTDLVARNERICAMAGGGAA